MVIEHVQRTSRLFVLTYRSTLRPQLFRPLGLALILPRSSTLREPLLRRLPVDHIPHRLEVLGLPVLILQVVGMLPSVDAEQWSELAHNGILVGVGADEHLSRLGILDEPGPAAALDAGKGGVEFVAEGGEGAVRCLDCGLWVGTSRG